MKRAFAIALLALVISAPALAAEDEIDALLACRDRANSKFFQDNLTIIATGDEAMNIRILAATYLEMEACMAERGFKITAEEMHRRDRKARFKRELGWER